MSWPPLEPKLQYTKTMVRAEAEETVDVAKVAEGQKATPLLHLHTTIGPMDPIAVTHANSAPDVRKDIKKKQQL